MIRNRKGQSILEYVIVLAVVIGAIIVAVGRFANPDVENGSGLGSLFNKAGNKITTETQRIADIGEINLVPGLGR